MNVGNGYILVSTGFLNDLAIVSKGNVYIGDPAGNISIPNNQINSPNSTSTLAQVYVGSTQLAQIAYLNQQLFFASGISTIGVMSTNAITSTSTNAMGILQASTTPSSAVPTFCSLAVDWRGRLVLAMDQNNPQNFYMSRVGVPTDWNYSATDPATAVAGNLSDSGQIGEPITCVIPFNDDLMIISTVNNIWLIEGDPAQGGSIVLLTRGGGIIGPRAWAVDPTGTLYYVTQAGLWSVVPIWSVYRPPQLLSGANYSFFFETVDPTTFDVQLQWDTVGKYLRIFLCNSEGSIPATHLVWDSRNGGFWPQNYGQYGGGAVYPAETATFIAGVGSNAQFTAIGDGSPSGNVFTENIQNLPLSGSYTSFLQYGPFQLDPTGQSLLQQIEIEFGELPPYVAGALGTSTNAFSNAFNGTITVVSGPTAADVTDDTYPAAFSTASTGWPANWPIQVWTESFTFDRRQPVFLPRLAGEWFSLQLNVNGAAYMSVEKIQVTGIPYGMNRTYR